MNKVLFSIPSARIQNSLKGAESPKDHSLQNHAADSRVVLAYYPLSYYVSFKAAHISRRNLSKAARRTITDLLERLRIPDGVYVKFARLDNNLSDIEKAYLLIPEPQRELISELARNTRSPRNIEGRRNAADLLCRVAINLSSFAENLYLSGCHESSLLLNKVIDEKIISHLDILFRKTYRSGAEPIETRIDIIKNLMYIRPMKAARYCLELANETRTREEQRDIITLFFDILPRIRKQNKNCSIEMRHLTTSTRNNIFIKLQNALSRKRTEKGYI